jgi:hypothetical protein
MDDTISLDVDSLWISPYALSAFVALSEKGLSFTKREVHLEKQEHKASDFIDRSLTGRVPVLRHGDFYLAESQAIGEYLAETFPAPTVTVVDATTITFSPVLGAVSGEHSVVANWGAMASSVAADYHLTAGSVCIDQGDPTGAPAIDHDGQPRTPPPDIGAYEYRP